MSIPDHRVGHEGTLVAHVWVPSLHRVQGEAFGVRLRSHDLLTWKVSLDWANAQGKCPTGSSRRSQTRAGRGSVRRHPPSYF